MTRLIFAFVLITCLSCEKENDNLNKLNIPQTFVFDKSDFVGSIECYDSLLNRIDFNPEFVKNDFLFYDGGIYPYERIDINEDSTTYYFYTLKEITNSDKGYVSIYKDTLDFYITNRYQNGLIFKGVIKGEILRIPSYGCRIQYVSDNNYSYYSSYTEFGYPDLQKIKYDHSDFMTIERIFIQKFDLVYIIQ